MAKSIQEYNQLQSPELKEVCEQLEMIINMELVEAECKIWHAHPVWFLEGNPIVGYSVQKAGVRLMFWSGQDFNEAGLTPSKGKFKDASATFVSVNEIDKQMMRRWLNKSREIQWDYKNIVKRKGQLLRLK